MNAEKLTLSQLEWINKYWFKNSWFFNDISHELVQVKGKWFILNKTFGFSDMFGRPKKAHWKIHPIDSTTKEILFCLDQEFRTKEECLAYLNNDYVASTEQ